jgi:hypothetical protein
MVACQNVCTHGGKRPDSSCISYCVATRLSAVEGPFLFWALEQQTGTLLVCLQYDGDDDSRVSLLRGLNAAVQRAHAESADRWPAAFCNELDLFLRTRSAHLRMTSSMCVAMAIHQESIHICSAGDLRVDLLADGRSYERTHDHIRRNDLPDTLLTDDPLSLTPTRWLGGQGSKPPECYRWGTSNRDAILVCSSEYHRYDYGDKYIESAVTHLTTMRSPKPGLCVLMSL